MKGDFTRFTFRPEKRYTSVLMQQGRLQLDSDWNEQTSIQAFLYQAQALDMVGASGAPKQEDGFRLTPTADGSDLLINPGSFYLNGILCELPLGTAIQATRKSSTTVQVPSIVLDGQVFAENQWVELTIDSGTTRSKQVLKIAQVDLNLQQLTFASSITLTEAILDLRRLTTYLTQPDHPQAARTDTGNAQIGNAAYLSYLDVWQRHITAIEDPEIREEALEVPDTTTRTKTIWQVKLRQVEATPVADEPQEWQSLIRDRRIYLNARVQSASGSDPSRSSQRLENQLYRVEIHAPGAPGTALFKWSRDNGSVVSAIKGINPRDNLLEVQTLGLDASQSFTAGQWVEVTDELRELNNQPGTLVRLKQVVTGGNFAKLVFDPATMAGDSLNLENFPIDHKPKVRRWDWEQNQAGLPTSSISPDGWIDLENGIQVKFEVEQDSQFQTGDYWLIPSRAVTNTITWQRDGLGRPLRQSPQGIQHQYAQLAVVRVQDGKFQPLRDEDDRRITFPTLKDCFDKSGDSLNGSFGIGVRRARAKLHVQGEPAKNGTGTLSSNDTRVTGIGTQFVNELHPGDVITAANQQRSVVAVADDGTSFTVDRPFNPPLSGAGFTFQTPVIRLDDGDRQPQTVLNATGNLGIGTVAPEAKLTVQDSLSAARPAATTAALHVKNADSTQKITSLLYVGNNGNVGIGTSTPDTQLHINGGLKLATTNDDVQVAIGSSQVNFTTTTSGYEFDKRLTLRNGATVNAGGVIVESGDIAVNNGQITIGALVLKSSAPQISLSSSDKAQITLLPSGNVGIGTPTPQSTFDVAGSITIGFNVAGQRPAPPNGLLVEGDVGIGISPDNARLQVEGLLKLSDGSAFVNVQPGTEAIDFTASTGYRFDQDVTVTTGGLAIAAGGASITAGGLTIAAGGANINGAVAINAETGGTGGTLTVARGLTLTAGDLTIAGTLKASSSSLSLATSTGTAISLSDDNVRVGGITSSSPVPKLEVVGASSLTRDEPIFQVSKTGNVSLFKVRNNGEINIGESVGNNPVNGTLKLLGSAANLAVGTAQSQAALHVQGGTTVEIDGAFASRLNSPEFQQHQAIARFGNSQGDTQLFFTAALTTTSTPSSKTMILGVTPNTDLFMVANKISAIGEWRVSGQTLQVSSRTLKQNISELSSQEAKTILKNMNPVKFSYRADQNSSQHLGFIAEDLPEAVVSSDRQAVDLMEIVAVLTRTVKDQQRTINSLVKVAKEQQQAIAALKTQKNL
jgi:hypothetical protein